MQPRIEYAKVAPGGDEAMRKLETYGRQSGLEPSLQELAKLRASQINGMSNEIRLTPLAWQDTYSPDAKASDSTFWAAGGARVKVPRRSFYLFRRGVRVSRDGEARNSPVGSASHPGFGPENVWH